jgi:hypothetical protein
LQGIPDYTVWIALNATLQGGGHPIANSDDREPREDHLVAETDLERFAQRLLGGRYSRRAVLAADVFALTIIDRDVEDGSVIELENAADLPPYRSRASRIRPTHSSSIERPWNRRAAVTGPLASTSSPSTTYCSITLAIGAARRASSSSMGPRASTCTELSGNNADRPALRISSRRSRWASS